MSPIKTFAAAALAIIAMPLAACSEESAASVGSLAPATKQQMEQMVHDYLIANPEVILEAVNGYQQRQREAAQAGQRDVMKAMTADLKNNPNDPSMGNPDGDVTVVEFFDYRCGYCKRAFKDVQTLLNDDGKIRLVLKEFPILGPDSVYASRAAQAVWLHQQDKYAPFHGAMMDNKGALGKDRVLELAKGAGVDTAALADQMNDPQVDATLDATARQAQALDITGTPAFVFGSQIQPGAIALDTMRELVSAMRKHP